jgi:integration host factor subunit alpha
MHQNKRNNFKKKDISENIFNSIGLSKSYSKQALNDLIVVLKNILLDDDKLILKNFGTFKLYDKNERKGRNPKNNKPYSIKKRRVVLFKISNILKNKININ